MGEWDDKEGASNLDKGLLSMPVELRTEFLDYYPTIGLYTHRDHNTVLHEFYLVRTQVLRALSQVCVEYRRIFYHFSGTQSCFLLQKAWCLKLEA